MKGDTVLFGWAQGKHNPANVGDSNSPIDFHDNGFGVVAAIPKLAANPSYDAWASVNQVPKTAAPKQTSIAPKWAGSQTVYPTFPKMSDRPPRETATFGTTTTTAKGVESLASTSPASFASSLKEGGSPRPTPPIGASPSAAPTPFTTAAPNAPPAAVPVAPGQPSIITITRSEPFELPQAGNNSDSPKQSKTKKPSNGQGGAGHDDDDGWADVRTVDIRLFNTAAWQPAQMLASLTLNARQVAQSTNSPTTFQTSPAQIPAPSDDLGLFPKGSGVPNKPPGNAGGSMIWPTVANVVS